MTSETPATRIPKRVAVITAYHKEERPLLERCFASVAAQTHTVDHIVVADGHPQDWIDSWHRDRPGAAPLRHIRLDRAHADYGNTPRGVGALLAISEGYDAFSFIDADNWLEPTHVAACLDAAAKLGEDCDYVIARRTFRRPDETILPVKDEPIAEHVDTNCFFFLPGSFHMLHHFANLPRPLSIVGDRLFYAAMKVARLKAVALTRPTVNYHCLWIPVYRAAGETPPPGAKPAADQSAADRWLAGLGARDKQVLSRLTGLPFG